MNCGTDIDKNIVFIGMPGCGKTAFGKTVSQMLGLDFYDVDAYVEKKAGITINEIFNEGEDYFRGLESQAVEEITQRCPCVISTGGGIVKVARNIEIIRKSSIVVFINRPVENIIKDIDISTRPLLKDGREVLYKLYNERYPLYKNCCDIEVINEGEFASVAEEIIRLLTGRKDLFKNRI